MALVIPDRLSNSIKVTPDLENRWRRHVSDRSRRLSDENVSTTAALGITKFARSRGVQALSYTNPNGITINGWTADQYGPFLQPSAGRVVGYSFYVRSAALDNWTAAGGIRVGVFDGGVIIHGTEYRYTPSVAGVSHYEAIDVVLPAGGGKSLRFIVDTVNVPQNPGSITGADSVTDCFCGFIVWITTQFV